MHFSETGLRSGVETLSVDAALRFYNTGCYSRKEILIAIQRRYPSIHLLRRNQCKFLWFLASAWIVVSAF